MTDESALEEGVRTICKDHEDRIGALLPILHAVQARYGHISRSAQATIAHALNISRAEVHGVVGFYHDFRDKPGKLHTLKVCRAEACQSVGGRAIWDVASTTDSDAVEVEAVYCLGNCACAPAVQFDGKTLGRMDPSRVRLLIRSAGEKVAS